MTVNRVNPSHLRPEPFYVGDDERGLHYVERIGDVDGYVVTVDLAGPLPSLTIGARGLTASPGHKGVPQRIFAGAADPVDLALEARSPGDGFPGALCRAKDVAELLRKSPELVELITVGPIGNVARLVCRTIGDPRFCLALAEALVKGADDLVHRGIVFPDAALARIGVHTDAEPSPEVIEKLASHLTEVTHWLAGHAARVGDAVEAHLTLDEAGVELSGVLRLAWRDALAVIVDASLDAALPQREAGALVLSPQRGPWAQVRALAEVKVGDAELDDAWLIEGDSRHAALVCAARTPLLDLIDDEARVEIDGERLKVLVPPKARSPLDVHQLADTMLLLWRRAAIVRAGHALTETPEDE